MRLNPDLPHRYRATTPMWAPRYFPRRPDAEHYARHTPGAVLHVRTVHENGATGPWEEMEIRR